MMVFDRKNPVCFKTKNSIGIKITNETFFFNVTVEKLIFA